MWILVKVPIIANIHRISIQLLPLNIKNPLTPRVTKKVVSQDLLLKSATIKAIQSQCGSILRGGAIWYGADEFDKICCSSDLLLSTFLTTMCFVLVSK